MPTTTAELRALGYETPWGNHSTFTLITGLLPTVPGAFTSLITLAKRTVFASSINENSDGALSMSANDPNHAMERTADRCAFHF